MIEDKEQGIKRIRLVASLIAAGMFFMTAVTQFRGEAVGTMIVGVLLSAIIGFGFMWTLMTIVKYILRLIRK